MAELSEEDSARLADCQTRLHQLEYEFATLKSSCPHAVDDEIEKHLRDARVLLLNRQVEECRTIRLGEHEYKYHYETGSIARRDVYTEEHLFAYPDDPLWSKLAGEMGM